MKNRCDDVKLHNHKGLEKIPIEIRSKGTQEIAKYLLDLAKSSQSIYKTKLMVVGFENVGKTTLLDCLFPLTDVMQVPNFFGINSEYYFTLEGKHLKQYYQEKLYKHYILENKEWTIKKIETQSMVLEKIKGANEKITFNFKDQETRETWFERISKLVSNKATHGIEVNTQIWKYSTLNQHQSFKTRQNESKNNNNEKVVEFSTWDFAGQDDYYNTHHYFLSNRSIFLVLYRMDQGIKGLEGLDFWLKSLSSHLNQDHSDENGKPFYSIIIIGTFLDSIVDNQNNEKKNLRQTKIMEIYDKNGLKSPPFYLEVSCSSLTNIEELREIIFNISLGHSYMGENVPVGYLTIEKSIYELRKFKKDHPIITDIQDLILLAQSKSTFKFDIEFTKRALKLLREWGVCIYFDNPIELSNVVVLDPQYLTKKVLGDLFRADGSTRKMRLNGIIEYSYLSNIWKGSTILIDTYLSLLEKFEICFIVKDQQIGNGGDKKKLIIPNLLLENKMRIIEDKFERKWPTTIPRGEIEIERIFSFNQVPSEMVSRLLVRFHNRIVDNIIWRRGVLLKHDDDKNVLCLLEVKMLENLFEIRIRGKERKECLEMMKYIYEEVKIVSENYGGVRWIECVRSPHFSKGLIDLDRIEKDRKLKFKDRKLKCPITHFPIYAEDLLIKTGLLDTLDPQDNFGTFFLNSFLFFLSLSKSIISKQISQEMIIGITVMKMKIKKVKKVKQNQFLKTPKY